MNSSGERRLWLQGCASLCLLVVASVLLAGVAPVQAQDVYEWDYYVFVGLEHPVGENAVEFAEAVKEATDGRLEITVRPAGELPYKATEVVRVVGRGSVQLGDAASSFVAGDVPMADLPSFPLLVQTPDELRQATDIVIPYLEETMEKQGASILYWYAWPIQKAWGTGEPVRTLDGFKGKKVRVTGSKQGELVNELGGTPVTFTTSEVPTAMRRGVMDMVFTAAFNAYGAGWGEFLDWAYTLPVNAIPSYIAVNDEALAELPPDLRSTLMDVAKRFEEKLIQEIPASEDRNMQLLQEEYGLEAYEPSESEVERAEELMGDNWKQWAREQMGSEGLEALGKIREKLDR